MKILVLASFFYPHRGGLEDYIHILSKGLSKRGFEVDVITCNTENAKEYEEIDGFHIYRIPCWNIVGKQYPLPKPTLKTYKLFKSLLNKNYTYINTHTRFWVLCLIGLFIAKYKKIKLVHVEHGSVHSIVRGRFVGICAKIYDHTFGALLVKNADILIGVSDGAIEFARHLGAKGGIYRIPKGLDLEDFTLKDNEIRKKIGLSDDDRVIIYVGRLIYGKGVQDLIYAFKKIEKEFDNVKLLIVGDGDYRKELEKLKDKNIIFLGETSHDDVVRLLNASDIFVNPSYSEGLPTTVLEAGAVGLPVIATDVGGTREIITNDINGFLIPPYDSITLYKHIASLLNDKYKVCTFREKIRKDVLLNYTSTIMIKSFEGLYCEN